MIEDSKSKTISLEVDLLHLTEVTHLYLSFGKANPNLKFSLTIDSLAPHPS